MKLCAHGAAQVTEAGYGSQGMQECTGRAGEVSNLTFKGCKEQNKAQKYKPDLARRIRKCFSEHRDIWGSF